MLEKETVEEKEKVVVEEEEWWEEEDEDEEEDEEWEEESEEESEEEDGEEEEEEEMIHVKFVTNKKKTKVLFAEAGSDFTNSLLSFLLLPLGTIVKVMKERYLETVPVIGSLSTLYNGIENLDGTYFRTEDAKSLLLNPNGDDKWPELNGDFTVSTAAFTISDDLRVKPIVEGSIVSTLSNLGFAMTDMDGAMTLDVDFDYYQVQDLLKEALIFRNPLTAFLLPGCGIGISRAAAKNQIGKKAIFMNSKKMFLKVMMQKSTNKLLFAQTHGDFVSFLFGALALPLGRVEWYLHGNTGLRAMDNLYRSISDSLDSNGLMSPQAKDLLLNPALSNDKESSSEGQYNEYSSSNEYIPLNFDPSMNQYHVIGSRMYMVSDDLTVSPLSITSGLSVIKNMKISLSDVEELELQVGLEEGLSILKAALTSTTALTDGLINPILKKQSNQENYSIITT